MRDGNIVKYTFTIIINYSICQYKHDILCLPCSIVSRGFQRPLPKHIFNVFIPQDVFLCLLRTEHGISRRIFMKNKVIIICVYLQRCTEIIIRK